MSVFEALMLLCFGLAWPVSIYKSARSKTAKGKSLPFLVVVLLGYIFGIIHKMLYSRDLIILLYILNGLMVLIDLLLSVRNYRLDRVGGEKGDKKDKKKGF